ncbi:MAG: DEAD/DEAH box helicase [Candidatus Competibacteraceae bacterium]
MPDNILNLLPPQQEILESGLLESGFHCILQMPTGSGKTWLAEQAMAEVLAQGLRVIYVAPLRALVNELGQVWQRRFPEHRIGLFTGDYVTSSRAYPVPFHEAQLLVMTPERLDLCTRSGATTGHGFPKSIW